jgi:hypothetical protein
MPQEDDPPPEKEEESAPPPPAEVEQKEPKPEPEKETEQEPEKQDAKPSLPPPIITRVHPTSGSMSGGTRITLAGTGFVAGCEVKIGGVPVTASVDGSTAISLTTLARNLPGRVDVDVVNPDGQRTVVPRAFDYCAAPTLARIEPDHAPETGGGGVRATLTGADLREGSEVRIGASRPKVDYRGPTRIDLEIGAHPAGTYDVELTGPDGQEARLPAAFHFHGRPRVTRVTPDRGPVAGGTRIAIEGEGFRTACVVYLGGTRLPSDLESASRISAVAVAHETPGPVLVRVINVDGLDAELAEAFCYEAPEAQAQASPATPDLVAAIPEQGPAPVLSSLSPPQGSTAGGQVIELQGERFDPACTVTLGGFAAPCEWLSFKALRAVAPARSAGGEVSAVVTNPDGQSAMILRAFTYVERKAPEITGVAPASGPTTGGTGVLLQGDHFDAVARVLVGGEPALNFKVRGRELALVTPPRKREGAVDLELRTRGGESVLRKNAFQYVAVPAPVIQSVSPNRGSPAGGTEVTVAGEHFVAGMAVLVAGEPAASVKLKDRTTIVFKTPPGDDGAMVDVAVQSPTGQEAVAKRAFLYDARYR